MWLDNRNRERGRLNEIENEEGAQILKSSAAVFALNGIKIPLDVALILERERNRV